MKPHDRVTQWLAFAAEDLQVCRLLLREGVYNQVCFHAQQAAEKMLKAFLKSRTGRTPRIHNLLELHRHCVIADASVAVMKDACRFLDQFYAPTRYPDAFPGSLPDRLPNEDEARQALQHAEEIAQIIQQKIRA